MVTGLTTNHYPALRKGDSESIRQTSHRLKTDHERQTIRAERDMDSCSGFG
jgi:hypothetical protein